MQTLCSAHMRYAENLSQDGYWPTVAVAASRLEATHFTLSDQSANGETAPCCCSLRPVEHQL